MGSMVVGKSHPSLVDWLSSWRSNAANNDLHYLVMPAYLSFRYLWSCLWTTPACHFNDHFITCCKWMSEQLEKSMDMCLLLHCIHWDKGWFHMFLSSTKIWLNYQGWTFSIIRWMMAAFAKRIACFSCMCMYDGNLHLQWSLLLLTEFAKSFNSA